LWVECIVVVGVVGVVGYFDWRVCVGGYAGVIGLVVVFEYLV